MRGVWPEHSLFPSRFGTKAFPAMTRLLWSLTGVQSRTTLLLL
jgi:hypothetical protein